MTTHYYRNTHKMLKYNLSFFLTLFVFFAHSQTDVGSWLIYKNKLKLNNQLNFDSQYQHRSFNLDLEEDQRLITVGLTHKPNPNISLSAGYRQIAALEEHGAYQKIAIHTQLNCVRLTNTFFIEERWLANNLQMRYRFGLTANMPLSPKLSLLLSEEVFLQNSATSFNQNRAAVQLSHRFSEALQLNTGLMHWQFNTFKRWVFTLSLSHNISL